MGATLLLVRHAAADSGSNGGARLCGWLDVPLTDLGRLQVDLLRRRLACAEAAAVYASPLRRATETATAAPTSLPVRAVSELREIHCGAFEGKLLPEIEARHTDLWKRNLAQNDDDFCWPGGESYRRFRERALAAVRDIASRHEGERAIVVTHSGLISQILGALAGLSPAHWEPYRPGYASITELHWTGDTGTVISFDDRAHLGSLSS